MNKTITLEEYKKLHKLNPKIVVECFLMREDELLLGYKKRGFGMGKWLGVGGKVEESESIDAAIQREVYEEIHVRPVNIQACGLANFYFLDNTDNSMSNYFFICDKWDMNPTESEEIKPKWFNQNKVPFDNMFEDMQITLPYILKRKACRYEFLLDAEMKVIDWQIK